LTSHFFHDLAPAGPVRCSAHPMDAVLSPQMVVDGEPPASAIRLQL